MEIKHSYESNHRFKHKDALKLPASRLAYNSSNTLATYMIE